MTKSRTAATVTSNEAAFNYYNTDNILDAGRGGITGTATIGSPTVDQTRYGSFRPSTQAAIDNFVYMLLPIGTVLTTTSVGSPSGIAFREELTFSGTADDVFIHVYGIQVPVAVNDDGTAIAAKVKAVLDTTDLFQSVVQTSNILTITHNDRFPHPAESTLENGVSVTGNILDISDATHICYGDWILIHSEVLGSTNVYHWLRNA